jgi:SnoaL-like polyketide cyclase.
MNENGSLSVNDGLPAVGRAAIAENARGFMSTCPDMVATMNDLTHDSDGTKFHWTLTGTNTGPGGTGKRVRISGYKLWQFDNAGLIAESKGHFDSREYERQLKHGVDGFGDVECGIFAALATASPCRRGDRICCTQVLPDSI